MKIFPKEFEGEKDNNSGKLQKGIPFPQKH